MFNNLRFMPAVLKLNVRHPKAYLEYSFDNTPNWNLQHFN